MSNIFHFSNSIEVQEIVQKLRDHGYGELVDCLLDGDRKCWTKKDRLNKSSTCRELDWKGKKLEDAMKHMRSILKDEFGIEDEFDIKDK